MSNDFHSSPLTTDYSRLTPADAAIIGALDRAEPVSDQPDDAALAKQSKNDLGNARRLRARCLASSAAALDTIFAHPNVPPFISKQLIQRLVTSNPSPAYVARVSAVFARSWPTVLVMQSMCSGP